MMVPNFTDSEWYRRNSNEKLINVISKGKGTILALKDKMNEEQIKSMVVHIRNFPDRK